MYVSVHQEDKYSTKRQRTHASLLPSSSTCDYHSKGILFSAVSTSNPISLVLNEDFSTTGSRYEAKDGCLRWSCWSGKWSYCIKCICPHVRPLYPLNWKTFTWEMSSSVLVLVSGRACTSGYIRLCAFPFLRWGGTVCGWGDPTELEGINQPIFKGAKQLKWKGFFSKFQQVWKEHQRLALK